MRDEDTDAVWLVDMAGRSRWSIGNCNSMTSGGGKGCVAPLSRMCKASAW